MKILLQPKQIRGRIVKIAASKGGIFLPSNNTQKKESILFVIDELGSAVDNPLCKVGAIIVPLAVNNIVLRDQTIHLIQEDLVFVGVDDISFDQLEVEGPNGAMVPFKDAPTSLQVGAA